MCGGITEPLSPVTDRVNKRAGGSGPSETPSSRLTGTVNVYSGVSVTLDFSLIFRSSHLLSQSHRPLEIHPWGLGG